VHSHLDHLLGLLDLAKTQEISDVCIHAITDGRDTSPKEVYRQFKKSKTALTNWSWAHCHPQRSLLRNGSGSSLGSRQKSLRCDHPDGSGDGRSTLEVLQASYAENVADEFVIPTRIAPGALEPGDGVIFFNFRPDRARQLTQALSLRNLRFLNGSFSSVSFATFTQYEPNLPVLVAFEPQN
jgi:2,3-bisphosphoglycerate-independent phosphoglycerate mutase